MDKDKDVILVTGSTGNQGGSVAYQLLSKGYRVRAMTRNPQSEKGRALSALGAMVVGGDFDDPESLKSALKGVWGAYSVQNTWEAGVEREEEQGKRFAEIARESGVVHFVYSSVGSAHRNTGIPHFDNKWRVENKIRSLAFPSYTIIRPAFFMENFVSPWFKPGLMQGKLKVALRPDTALQMIAVEDIGKFGMLAFERHEQMNGVELDIAGDRRTMPETAEVLGRAMGRQVGFERTPLEEVRKWSADFAVMLEWFDRVGYNADIRALEKDYGVRLITLSEWAARIDWKQV
ncbi:MAG: NmrA/HSCARG family protein [Nitrospirae bacterium]|nr:NmrA/HSCARG family protein [Nitrospirota bacterium]